MEWSLGYELFWLSGFIAAIAVAISYERSSVFRYRFKFAVYIGYFSFVALCMIPFCVFRPKNVKNILLGIPFIRPINKFLGIHWEVTGQEILAKDFPCVVVCNHQSMLDVLVTVELWPTMKKCACIAKKEVFYVFPFGLMAWLCGTIYINRRDSRQSQMTVSTSAEKIRNEKTKMWIFPEGTRNKGDKLLPFKKGAFHIAMSNKLPIVPVVVSPYTFVNDEKQIFESGTMKIKILNPIDTSTLKYPDDVSKLAQNCQEIMSQEFQRMKEEMESGAQENCNNNGISYGTRNKPIMNSIFANGNAYKSNHIVWEGESQVVL